MSRPPRKPVRQLRHTEHRRPNEIIGRLVWFQPKFPSVGKQKLDAVTDAVSSVAAAIPQIAEHAQALKAEVVPHVNALVAVFNALGILKRSTPAAGAPA